jgi:hypothetical protein
LSRNYRGASFKFTSSEETIREWVDISGCEWPPNHQVESVYVLGVTDPDGDPVAITIESIYQDEPVNGKGDGNTAPDGSGVGMLSMAMVRRARARRAQQWMMVLCMTRPAPPNAYESKFAKRGLDRTPALVAVAIHAGSVSNFAERRMP